MNNDPKKSPERSEELLQLLVKSVKDYAIFALDRDGHIVTWNEGARRLKGYEPNEIIGSHFSRFYIKEDIVRNHPWWELEQAAKNGAYEEEGWRLKKDGTRFWANVVITALRDSNGDLRGYAKVTRDLTDRKNAEDRLKAAHDSLEKRVQERTAELESAKEQAEKSLQSRDEFFSIASHELRTPITSLKLKSQLAKRSFKGKTDLSPVEQKFFNYVSDIDQQMDRLARLVEDMLDLTRISQGRLAMEMQKVDLCKIAQSVVDRMALQFKENVTPLEFRYCEDAFILADPLRAEQVTLNLLANALRYAPGKPVLVEVEVKKDFIFLVIEDRGPGIAKENHEKIFSRYERIGPENVSGLGIGLYLSKLIVEAHGGSIEVESELGKGARFIVKYPRSLFGE